MPDLLRNAWGDAVGRTATRAAERRARWRAVTATPDPDADARALLYLEAISEWLGRRDHTERPKAALRALRAHLALSYDDVGRMLGTSGETARRWELGKVTIPQDRRAQLSRLDDGLARLRGMLLSSRLSEAIRRPAEIFDGERALDWILRGKIADVVRRYDMALAYQG